MVLVGVVVVRDRVIGRVVRLVLWGSRWREGVSPGVLVGLGRGGGVVFGLGLGVGIERWREGGLIFQVVAVFLSSFLFSVG
jgi:hypothetical protein